VFNGKIIVRPGAQKIDSRQSSRNLLLSSTAEIDTKPELEIYANDVKCSHGATTGQLDATALFYLRSRGVSEDEARALLIRAFAETILTSIEDAALRTHLEAELDRRFVTTLETRA
jgi:Fe-S cluster assembly protein SufD